MQEYKAECPKCPELYYVSDTRWTWCPVHGVGLFTFAPVPAPGTAPQPSQESPGQMTIVRFNIAVEAKKVAQGRKTKVHEYVLLRLLAGEYLRTK
jgi:hypothetical protein